MASSTPATTEGFTYRYPRPGLTVDTVIVAEHPAPSLLLILRKHSPCQGRWALPGGFVDELESLVKAAERELQEETSVDPKSVLLQQVGAYGEPGRDPRGWTVTVGFAALVPHTDLGVQAADDAADARWYPVDALPSLAFDHQLIVRDAFRKLARAIREGANGGGEAQASRGGSASSVHTGLERALEEAAAKLDVPWVPPTE